MVREVHKRKEDKVCIPYPVESVICFAISLDPGIDDEGVLLRSRQANAILLTADKDFGELVFRQRLLHSGVLLFRLGGLEPDAKAGLVATAFDRHGEDSPPDLRFFPSVRCACVLPHAQTARRRKPG